MRKESLDKKERAFGLYNLVLERLEKIPNSNGIISFPDVFECLCRSLQIRKKFAWELLFILRDFGFLKIIVGKGVILYTI
jgi:hypothetical protein